MSAARIGRRRLAAAAAAAGLAPRFAAAALTRVIAGAIRWDAWYSPLPPASEAQYALSFPPWRNRAPWFARVDAHGDFTAIGTGVDMDLECQAAASMGLSYWAFVMYAPDSPMSVAWHLYQASPKRHLVNWCAIIGPGFLGNCPFSRTAAWHAKDAAWVDSFRQPNYQHVEINRPLLYILWSDHDLKYDFAGQLPDCAQSIAYLRAACAAAGVGDPYIAVMAGRAAHSAAIARAIGADAISDYIPDMGAPPKGAVPWAVLDARTRAFWAQLAGQGVDCIPIATTGWDTRARREHPESWTHAAPQPDPQDYFVLPTDTQLRAHLAAAETFIRDHPAACPSRALLIYSWDECDEGGNPLIPTKERPMSSELAPSGAISKIAPLF